MEPIIIHDVLTQNVMVIIRDLPSIHNILQYLNNNINYMKHIIFSSKYTGNINRNLLLADDENEHGFVGVVLQYCQCDMNVLYPVTE